MTNTGRVPRVVTAERVWSADELSHRAWRWRAGSLADLADQVRPVAMVAAIDPQAIALLLALSALPAPIVLLSRDASAWQTSPPLPPGTPLALLPSQAALAARALALGLEPRVLDEDGPRAAAPAAFFQSPGLVLLTSGSSGPPKAVYRRLADALDSARYRAGVLGLSASSHVVSSLPLDRPIAIQQLMVAFALGSDLSLVDSMDYERLLRRFATGACTLWTSTPAVANVLVRASRGRHPAPEFCFMGGRVGARLFEAFADRFGVPLRGLYGSSESQLMAFDTRVPTEVRSAEVGPPLAVVDLRIGDHPARAVAPGEVGRIWVKTPWLMAGYGYPPELEPPTLTDGWWGTPDVGRLDDRGVLTVIGRLDDTVRTAAGHLVNLGHVETAVAECPGVADAVAVPIATEAGAMIGVLAEVGDDVGVLAIREALSGRLSAALMPHALRTTAALPRLPDGRPDRQRCMTVFNRTSRTISRRVL